MSMNPEIKQEWVDALRSGDYNQSVGTLQDVDGFCCLGVLTQLYADKYPDKMQTDLDEWGNTRYITVGNADEEPETSVLPQIVADWAGLTERNPLLAGSMSDDEEYTDTIPASEWNDDYGKDFNDLADMIEAQL